MADDNQARVNPRLRRFSHPIAIGYSVLVVSVAMFVALSLESDPGANFAAVWLIAVTLPGCIPLLAVWWPDDHDRLLILILTAAGLAQCWLLVGLRLLVPRMRGARMEPRA
jgi:cytochrome bd-type quinol oxidase subunit 2